MIDIVNSQYLTLEQRQASLRRALHSQVFFNLLEFVAVAAANNQEQFAAKTQVDKDFFVTNIQGNFWEVYLESAARYQMNLYTAQTGRALYQYIADENYPVNFQCTEARALDTLTTGLRYDDRQRELMPRLVKRGDSLVASAKNVGVKTDPANLAVVVSGYYVDDRPYLTEVATRGVNESLSKPIEFDQWRFDNEQTVDFEGNGIRTITNDRYARMILGFSIRNNGVGDGDIPSNGTFLITDVYRALKLNNVPINIGFFAPKQSQVKDAQIYFLPIEHFWEPFAPLKFDIVNELNDSTGYELIMLTRTV